MTKLFPSRASDKVLIRMPDGMRAWISDDAKRNLRSANAHIVWMLQRQIEIIQSASEGVAPPPKASPET